MNKKEALEFLKEKREKIWMFRQKLLHRNLHKSNRDYERIVADDWGDPEELMFSTDNPEPPASEYRWVFALEIYNGEIKGLNYAIMLLEGKLDGD